VTARPKNPVRRGSGHRIIGFFDGAPPLLDKELLDILACPACRADVRLEGDRLVCTSCGKRYPVRDGIPIMLVEEAESPSAGSGSEPKR
jgi:uncharacterized protein YbaR (Trm112 family)